MKSELILMLQERGFINQATNLEGLDALALEQKITSYIGFDLTADSLHVGSLVQIMLLRHMTKLGHDPLILLGEATTRIGDPSGKSAARPMLTRDQIEHNRLGIEKVFRKFVDNPTFVSNAAWFDDDTTLFGYLHDYGPHFSINRMLTFDSVKSRLRGNSTLSFLEFNYMLMQAIDFFKLSETMDCVLQIGGSDQWGNIINGVELVRRKSSREVFGLTTPLMTNSAGEKMGKTADGAIWLDPDKTSAFEFWQFWRNVEDVKVGEFLRLFTDLDLDEITRLEILGGQELNEAKKILATEVTAMVHGRATAAHVALLTTGGNVDPCPDSMPMHIIPSAAFSAGITLAQILLDSKLVTSKGEADRMAANDGVKINGHIVNDVREVLPRHAFEDNSFLLSVGKKKMIAVKIED
jgi:tyrosyl-tRNA synthetase